MSYKHLADILTVLQGLNACRKT